MYRCIRMSKQHALGLGKTRIVSISCGLASSIENPARMRQKQKHGRVVVEGERNSTFIHQSIYLESLCLSLCIYLSLIYLIFVRLPTSLFRTSVKHWFAHSFLLSREKRQHTSFFTSSTSLPLPHSQGRQPSFFLSLSLSSL